MDKECILYICFIVLIFLFILFSRRTVSFYTDTQIISLSSANTFQVKVTVSNPGDINKLIVSRAHGTTTETQTISTGSPVKDGTVFSFVFVPKNQENIVGTHTFTIQYTQIRGTAVLTYPQTITKVVTESDIAGVFNVTGLSQLKKDYTVTCVSIMCSGTDIFNKPIFLIPGSVYGSFTIGSLENTDPLSNVLFYIFEYDTKGTVLFAHTKTLDASTQFLTFNAGKSPTLETINTANLTSMLLSISTDGIIGFSDSFVVVPQHVIAFQTDTTPVPKGKGFFSENQNYIFVHRWDNVLCVYDMIGTLLTFLDPVAETPISSLPSDGLYVQPNGTLMYKYGNSTYTYPGTPQTLESSYVLKLTDEGELVIEGASGVAEKII